MMAEFATVMHEMQRMCDAFSNADECQHCPLIHNPVCGTPSDMIKKDIRKAEAAIMAWAAEHPEPQYPTLVEWLRSLGLADHRMIDPIPADIAKKLGLEPKEG